MPINGVDDDSLKLFDDGVSCEDSISDDGDCRDIASTSLRKNSLKRSTSSSNVGMKDQPSQISVAGTSLDLNATEPISCFSFASDREDTGRPYYIIAKTEYAESSDEKSNNGPVAIGSKFYSGKQMIKWIGSEEVENNVPRDPMTNQPLSRVNWYLLVGASSRADFIGTWEKKPLEELSIYSRFLTANLAECKDLEKLPEAKQDLFRRAHDVALAMLILHGPKDLFGVEYFGISAEPTIEITEASEKAFKILQETTGPFLKETESLDKLGEWATSILVQPTLSYPMAKQVKNDILSKVRAAINESHGLKEMPSFRTP